MPILPTLFDPIQLGGLSARNRVVMAPLTRNRAGPQQRATPLMALYYAQRASAGLIVSEATQVSAVGQDYLDTPGIHNSAQVSAWRVVTDAVHAKGGIIVAQWVRGGSLREERHSSLHRRNAADAWHRPARMEGPVRWR